MAVFVMPRVSLSQINCAFELELTIRVVIILVPRVPTYLSRMLVALRSVHVSLVIMIPILSLLVTLVIRFCE